MCAERTWQRGQGRGREELESGVAQEEMEATRAENLPTGDPGPMSQRRDAATEGQARSVTVALGHGPGRRAVIRATEGRWGGQGKAECRPTLDT